MTVSVTVSLGVGASVCVSVAGTGDRYGWLFKGSVSREVATVGHVFHEQTHGTTWALMCSTNKPAMFNVESP